MARHPKRGRSQASKHNKQSKFKKLQRALAAMSNGESLAASARREGIPRADLRRILIKKNLGRKVKGRWVLGKSGGRRMLFFKNNEAYYVAISYRSATRYGAYLAARKAFLED